MKFSELKKTVSPLETVVVKPSAWTSSYPKRPEGEVALGLRLPSERELLTAHAEATKEADGRPEPDHSFRFQEALIAWTLGAALCDPNDAGKPYFQRGDEEIREAFPPETLRHLWHELERAQVAHSPVRPEITDEEARLLAQLLAQGALERAPAPRLRRLLRFCLDELDPTWTLSEPIEIGDEGVSADE